MIRHDTMKEILAQALRENEADATNVVSTIQPSQVDGFLNGLNALLYGRGGHYQVNKSICHIMHSKIVTSAPNYEYVV